jgi:hypothetical protein
MPASTQTDGLSINDMVPLSRVDQNSDLYYYSYPSAPVMIQTGDSKMSAEDIKSTASASDCANAVIADGASQVVVRPTVTFCILQRDDSVDHFGGQVLARLTISSVDHDGNVVLTYQRWKVVQ